MKKLLITILILGMAVTAYATKSTLLLNKTTTGVSGTVFVDGAKSHGMNCWFTNTSTVTVKIEGTSDKKEGHWYTIATKTADAADIAAGEMSHTEVNKLAEYVRFNNYTLVGSGASVTCDYMREAK